MRGLELTGIRATVRPDADGERAGSSTCTAATAARRRELWNAVGYIAADAQEGKLTLRCDRFKLSQLDSVLRNKDGTPEILNAPNAEMDAHLDLGFRDESARLHRRRAPRRA